MVTAVPVFHKKTGMTLHRRHGWPNRQWGMEKWKAKRSFHFPPDGGHLISKEAAQH
jgi:hypothetical protein